MAFTGASCQGGVEPFPVVNNIKFLRLLYSQIFIHQLDLQRFQFFLMLFLNFSDNLL